jgi:hypothetical protein
MGELYTMTVYVSTDISDQYSESNVAHLARGHRIASMGWFGAIIL